MKNQKKYLNENSIEDFLNLTCDLNFAYSPKQLLNISDDKKNIVNEFLNGKNVPPEYIDKLSGALRYIYICYSLKFSGADKQDNNGDLHYFYFQPFIISGEIAVPCKFESSFMKMDEVLDSINQISYMFSPCPHEKNILNLPSEDGNATQNYNVKDILEILSIWTEIKIKDANEDFLKNDEIRSNLIKIANEIDSISNQGSILGLPNLKKTKKSISKKPKMKNLKTKSTKKTTSSTKKTDKK